MEEPVRILLGAPLGKTQGHRLDLGVDHPSRSGVLELNLRISDGVIRQAEALPGAMHRGVEKLFEVRDFRAVLSLADRHDWQAPFFGELSAAMAVEAALAIEVPQRAIWLRTLLCEHFRMHSHLAFLSWIWHALAPDPRIALLRSLRERLRRQSQALTGNRVHPMVNRIGGLAVDADSAWLAAEELLAGEVAGLAPLLCAALAAAPAGVARLDEEFVNSYGLSGPTARATGLRLDLRPGTLTYDETGVDLATIDRRGDAAARLSVMAQELVVSEAVIAACVARLRELPGPVNVTLPKVLRVPEGDYLVELEAPLGVAGCFLVARGDKTPWRLKLRTPSFANVSALGAALTGTRFPDLELALASIGYVMGDLDK